MKPPIAEQIVNTKEMCRNFPRAASPKIPRDHMLELMDIAFSTGIKLIMLVGEPRSGKSQIAADYLSSRKNCIGVFLSPQVEIFQSPEYFRLSVAEQIVWMLDGIKLEKEVVSEASYARLLLRLQRESTVKGVTILVDGLNRASIKARHAEEIKKLIPFETAEFNIVITSDEPIFEDLSRSRVPKKVMEVPPVSPEETKLIFEVGLVSERDAQEIRAFCRSNVGLMAHVRSLLNDGQSLADLSSARSEPLAWIMEQEWGRVERSEECQRVTAAIVFAQRGLGIDELAGMFELKFEEVVQIVSGNRLLQIVGSDKLAIAEVASRSAKTYLQKKLLKFEAGVRGILIDSLISSVDQRKTAIYLPGELQKAGRDRELVDRLDSSHFLHLLEAQQTLRSLRHHAQMGFKAAQSHGNREKSWSFALLSSAVTGLNFSVGSLHKMEALVNLGRADEAIEQAAMGATTEERLLLLANAAAAIKASGGSLSPAIKQRIRDAAEAVDYSLLGEAGIETACNLIEVEPELAFEVMGRVVESARKKESRIEALKSEVAPTPAPQSKGSSTDETLSGGV